MNRFWKIFLISAGSLLLLALAAVGAALWLVFTPARLTPIVNRQAAKFVTCQAETDRVELTFFSSFPRLGLRADGVRLVNPVAGAPCDTLLRLGRLDGAIDLKAFLRRKEIILSDIVLRDGVLCLFADSLGNVNYDILEPGGEPVPEGEEGFTISYIDADRVTLKNVDVFYTDASWPLRTAVRGLSGTVKASVKDGETKAAITVEPFDADFSMWQADSLVEASVRGLPLNADVSLNGDLAAAKFNLGAAPVTFAYGGEEYLRGNTVEISGDASADLSAMSAHIANSAIRLDDLEMSLSGTLRSDTLRGLEMDLAWALKECGLSSVLSLVPASFGHYLEGIEASGRIVAEARIAGIYGEGSMPVADAGVVFSEGSVSYPEMLPYPLDGIFADLEIHADMTGDAASFVRVRDIKARTPKSSLRASGTIDRLFSDPHANLAANVDGDFADAAPFLPDSFDVSVSGKVSGHFKADASMSQIESMQLEKMKLSGSLLLSDLDARYDTVSVRSPSLKLDFSLPNANPSSRQASFAGVTVASSRLDAEMGGNASASAEGARIAVEMSDVRDTLNIPAVVCAFGFGKLAAAMDSMKVAVVEPSGKVSLEPARRNEGIPRIGVEYASVFLQADTGDGTVIADSVNLKAAVRYDESRENIWEKLMPRGRLNVSGAMADLDMLAYPVELPALAMDFDPRSWNIRKAEVRMGSSDFSLDGNVENIIQYLRGDSILHGELNFRSTHADIPQLMMLTSGLGTDERPDETATEFSGPYMVPKGVDITMHVDMKQAMWYETPLNNIVGDLWVRNGELVLDNMTLTSPATDAQIFMIYRTPRRDHLFAGASIHLLNIEFRDLLEMVPDLDSIMPMLRSFDGKGEFHFAMDTNLDSAYRVKIPTLLAEGSVTGTGLTLRDEEVFARIARFLKYRKEGVIRVDSLSAEFTIYRDEIDVYPFLIVLDRYKAVVGGRHNLDMSFDYNISLVQSPLPFRVTVDVTGNIDDLKFKLFRKNRYPDFYRPARRYNVENKELQLRNVIRDALTSKVILQPRQQSRE